MTTTTITDNTSIARRHKDSNKRGPSTCDRACAVIQSRLAGTTAVHVARTEAPSRTRLATSGSSTRHSNRRVTIQASARGNARPPQSQYPRATRERAAWRRCRTRSMAVNDSMSPTGTLSTHTDLAVSERDARPSQSQHSGRSCTQGRGGARRQEGLPPCTTHKDNNDHRHASMRPRTALVAVIPRFSSGQARTTRQRFEPDGRPHAMSPTS